ncbi:hypothetical protein [Mesorhizobium escarrei]|uniref:Uncharacterized protein n=1 Tax=Mesorhizobium escarrei TaxID=666018 RepID=A0ABM9DG30_9HYPH|nr:hypothetical protein [Mesorhizobium escarrei]CAH2395535.1 hypothetical protein MES5069_110085 [Mesorhizobium escarrei]
MVLDTPAKQVADEHHGVVVIGAGYDSAFFLQQFVGRTRVRVPDLEWRHHNTHDRQLERRANSNIRGEDSYAGNREKLCQVEKIPWRCSMIAAVQTLSSAEPVATP